MLREILSLGDKIEIKNLDHNGKPAAHGRTYVSQLIDFADLDVIQIAAPIVYGKTILLQVGESYNLCFYTDKGLYQCNCVALSSLKENRTIINIVRITSNLEKYQRRQYFRLECIHEVIYRIITKEEEILGRKMANEDFQNPEERMECKSRLVELNKAWVKGAITDLSGGGARFNSELQHAPGDKLYLDLDFISTGDVKKFIQKANVISSERIPARLGVYEHRVEFIDITQKERETLIRFIFEQERKRRRYDKA